MHYPALIPKPLLLYGDDNSDEDDDGDEHDHDHADHDDDDGEEQHFSDRSSTQSSQYATAITAVIMTNAGVVIRTSRIIG